MGDPDSIFHDLATQDPTGLARHILGDTSVEADGLPPSLPIVRRREGDTLLLIRRGREESLLHIECDLRRRLLSPRMLEYAAILAKREHRQARQAARPERPITSAVLRLHGAGHPPRRVSHEVRGLGFPTIVFHYHEVDVRGLDSEDLLGAGRPALLALVPLARGGDGEAVLDRAVGGIQAADVADEQRAAFLSWSWVFAAVVGSHTIVERLVEMRGLKDIPAIKQIFERGVAEGEAKALSRVLRARLARLGRPSRSLMQEIEGITDVSGLERLVAVALEVETLREFGKRAFPRPAR